MNSNSSGKIFIIILITISGLLGLFNLGSRDLWDPDETRYAVVAREMRESGNWILPHLNGAIHAEKPPMFFWLVNASVLFLGKDSEFTNRFPSALAGLMTILITFLFGERLFNLRVGFLSGLVLVTCFFFPQICRWMVMDSLFTLFFILSLFYFYEGLHTEEKRRRCYLVGGLFTGLGVLTKGPIAYLALPIFVIFAFSRKEIQKFWNRDLLLGFLLSLTVVFIWLLPACWLGGRDYTNKIIFGQAIGRLAGTGRHVHPKSLLFYIIRFPIEFLPWTIFLPSALLFGWRRKGQKEVLFLFIWFLFTLFFFTLSKGKKDNYILPLYPAAALMVGTLWDTGLDSKTRATGLLAGLTFLTSLIFLVLVVFLLKIPEKLYPGFEFFHTLIVFVSLYLLAGSSLSILLLIKKKGWASLICLVISFAFFHLHLSYALPQKLNAQRSVKVFSNRVLMRMEDGDELKTCFFRSPGLLYYTRKPLIEEIWRKGRILEVLQLPQRVFMVIQKEDLEQLKSEFKIEVEPIAQERVWHWELTLISNR